MNTNIVIIVVLGILLILSIVTSIIQVKRYKRMFEACVRASTKLCREKINSDWGLLADGRSGDKEGEKKFLRVAQTCYHIWVRKHHDYGDDNIKGGGLFGIVIRMGDKVARLWNVTRAAEQVRDETIADTLRDLFNYVVMSLMFVTGEWEETDMDAIIGKDAVTKLIANEYMNMTTDQRERLLANFLAVDLAEDLGGDVKFG